MDKYIVKLKIADVIIQMESRFPLKRMTKEEKRLQGAERFNNFFYRGKQKPHILINVEIVDKLPVMRKAQPVFITRHFQDGSENWRLLKAGEDYIYKSPLEDKKQLMRMDRTFTKVCAYLLPKSERHIFAEESRIFIRKCDGFTWAITDIIYDFLHVLLINYFAQRNQGIFTHAVGIKDIGGEGVVFAGKSGCGKSTSARIWHKHSRAIVLNDDRIIVRKVKEKFFIYGSPWHGDFSDYLDSRIESAPLARLFFIHHAPQNTVKRLSEKGSFSLLYPALFPPFWDKEWLINTTSFCQDLIKKVPCYSLGFVNDTEIIKFVRKIT